MMIVVAVVAMILGGYLVSLRSGYRYLEVENQAGQAIPRLTVIASGERREVENLADGASAMVPFWAGEGARFSVTGYLKDRTPVSTSFQLIGDPKRFRLIMGTVGPTGKFRLSLSD
jgi:hypothetical protein